MIRWKTTRWQILGGGIALLFVAVFLSSSFMQGTAFADDTHEFSGSYTVKVTITAAKGVTLPASDTVTVAGGTQTAKKVSGNATTATYETGSISWSVNGTAGDLSLSACSQALSGKCTAFNEPSAASLQGKADVITINGTETSTAAGGGGTTTTSAPSESPTCYTNSDPMSYVLCPIFNSLSAISNWIFQNILTPFLVTAPISTSSSDTSFKIWSSFRVYGDIILVIALLVAVIGQVIGGGVVDAYTFRKVIPRVLVAAILINLSVYIVALMVDITNIIGKSIGAVMTAPLAANNAWSFTPNGVESAGVFGAGLLGLLLGGTGVAVIADLFFSDKGGAAKSDFIKVALYAAMFVILPMVLAMIAVFITLIIRKGLILFLVIISPVAFALYCLPNTEKYFKKWWDLLLEALLVYPIIVVIFAVADILAVTILSANGITKTQLTPDASGRISLAIDSIIATMVAFFLQFLPLLAIPFSFRMAGGTLSRLHEAVTTGSGKINEIAQKRGAMAKRDFQVQKMQAQKRMYERLNNANPDSSNPFLRRRHSFLANRAGGYDINGAMSAMNAETKKEFDQTTNNGDDTQLRAFSVNKAAAISAGELKDTGDGYRSNGRMRVSADGKRQFKTLGGRWVGEGDVDSAQQRWKGNHFMQQQVLAYEMKKATTQQQNDELVSNYGDTARNWGMTNDEAGSAWTGAAYANQGNKLEMKYYKWDNKSGKLSLDGQGLAQEIDETRGTYDMSKFTADTWGSLEKETQNARSIVAAPNAGLVRQAATATKPAESDEQFQARVSTRLGNAKDTLQRGSRIARSFVQQRGSTSSDFAAEGDNVIPVQNANAGGRGGPVVAIHGAAPAAQEAAERFVQSMHETAEVPSIPSYAPGEEGQPQNRLNDQDRPRTGSKL